jgi:glutamine synthetase
MFLISKKVNCAYMELAKVKSLIEEGNIEYVMLGHPDTNGILRRKQFAGHHFLRLLSDGFPLSNAIFCWDIADNWLYPFKMGNIDQPFGDLIMRPDLRTFMEVAWENQIATCICDLWTKQDEPVTISSRYILRNLVEHARSLGFEPMFASELEMRIFREDEISLREKDFGPDLVPLHPLTKNYGRSSTCVDGQLINNIARMMHDCGIEIESYLSEHAPAMYELNTAYADALTTADRTMLFKTGIRDIVYQKGLMASFMARWNEKEDGSSGHVHMSLWDLNRERNLFWDEDAEKHMSTAMRHFLAGLLFNMPDFMAIYAPVINSYKRYVYGFSMNVPPCATWGIDNRSCVARVINNGQRAIRIENRVPGADANFYLVFAAMLASGLDGIERKLELPAQWKGNAHNPIPISQALAKGEIHPLAHNLTIATDMLEQSAIAKEYLGTDFIEHFITTRRWEIQQFEQAVTNWERRRYLELI